MLLSTCMFRVFDIVLGANTLSFIFRIIINICDIFSYFKFCDYHFFKLKILNKVYSSEGNQCI